MNGRLPITRRRLGGAGLCAALALSLPLCAPVRPLATPNPAAPADADADDAATAGTPPDEEPSLFRDPEDGWFDISGFLEHPAGFLPLVVPITEPAVGYGAVVGGAFLDPREEAGSEGWARPNITAVAGFRTENGSDGLFAGDSRIWDDGNRQTLVAVGDFGLDLALYGIRQDPLVEELDYRLDATGAMAELRERLGDSDAWLGLRLVYASADVQFDAPPQDVPADIELDRNVTLAGPAVTFRYDTLDNMFTPTRGLLSDTSVSVFDESFGGSQDFQLVAQALIHYWTLRDDLFLGARGQFNKAFGDVPFYARPYVQLRGVPSLRYQGEQAASGELELRWQFHERFGLVGFGGAGRAWSDDDVIERQQDAWGAGTGFRYLLSRRFGLHAGLDVARGPEETAVYVQVGSAWVRP